MLTYSGGDGRTSPSFQAGPALVESRATVGGGQAASFLRKSGRRWSYCSSATQLRPIPTPQPPIQMSTTHSRHAAPTTARGASLPGAQPGESPAYQEGSAPLPVAPPSSEVPVEPRPLEPRYRQPSQGAKAVSSALSPPVRKAASEARPAWVGGRRLASDEQDIEPKTRPGRQPEKGPSSQISTSSTLLRIPAAHGALLQLKIYSIYS